MFHVSAEASSDSSATGGGDGVIESGSQYCHTPLIVAYRRLAAYQGVYSAEPWRIVVVVAIIAKELPY